MIKLATFWLHKWSIEIIKIQGDLKVNENYAKLDKEGFNFDENIAESL